MRFTFLSFLTKKKLHRQEKSIRNADWDFEGTGTISSAAKPPQSQFVLAGEKRSDVSLVSSRSIGGTQRSSTLRNLHNQSPLEVQSQKESSKKLNEPSEKTFSEDVRFYLSLL